MNSSSAVILTILSIFAYSQASETPSDKVRVVVEKCKSELNSGHEVMKIVGTSALPENEEQRCFLECIYKKLELITDNKFGEPGAKRLMNLKYGKTPEDLKKAQAQIEYCDKHVQPTPGQKCSMAYNIRQCFATQGKKFCHKTYPPAKVKMLKFAAIFFLMLVHESFQTGIDLQDYSRVMKKYPSWSFKFESIDSIVERKATRLKRANPDLDRADLKKRLKNHFGGEGVTHFLRKVDDPNWPRNPPKEFDARKEWKDCSHLISWLGDESACNTEGPVVAASVLSDRYCVYTNGTHTQKLSAEVLAGCAEMCTRMKAVGYSLKHAETNGIPTGGYYGEKPLECVPYNHEPCAHFSNVSISNLRPCSELVRYDYECPIECTNKKHGKTMREELVYLSAWYGLPNNEFSMRRDIYAYGPIIAIMELYDDFLKKPDGMYRHERGPKMLDYLKYVKIIGWGEEDNTRYWLAVNGWDQWGSDKVFKIPRGVDHVSIEYAPFGGVFGEV